MVCQYNEKLAVIRGPYPAFCLTIMLAAIFVSCATVAHAAKARSVAQAHIVVSEATAETRVPALSDITAVLRAQFRVAPMESLKIARRHAHRVALNMQRFDASLRREGSTHPRRSKERSNRN